MEDRKVLTVNEEEIISKANEVAHRLWRKAETEIGLPNFLLKKAKAV